MEHCNTNDSKSSNDSCNYRLGDSDNDINLNKKIKHRKRKVIWLTLLSVDFL